MLHVGAGDKPHFLQPLGGHLADAGDLAERQLLQKRRHLRRRDHVLPVRLVHLGGDFGEKLDRRNAGRGGEVQFVGDRLADLLGDQRCRAIALRAVGHVEVGFIERQRLDQRSIAGEDFADMQRGLFVGRHAPRQQGEVRAQLERHRRGHGAVYAVATRRVVGGADHPAAIGAAANRQRDIAQAGIVAHFHRREEAVHIDMNDFTHRTLQ